jgi:hypothetical protein
MLIKSSKKRHEPKYYSPFCVLAKIIKLVGLKNGGRLSPINLVTFAGTQNDEYYGSDGQTGVLNGQFVLPEHAL